MRILYISHKHPSKESLLKHVGGMQRVSMQLVKELESNPDVEVIRLTRDFEGDYVEFKTALFLVDLYLTLPASIKKIKPDVILFSSMVTAGAAPFIRSKVDVPMVTINHGQDVTLPVGIYQKLVPHIFKSLKGVISVSTATYEECVKRGLTYDKGTVLPNGFDLEEFYHPFTKEEARNKLSNALGIDFSNRKLILTVGRQVRRKGHAWFLSNVIDKVNCDCRYLIIGDGPQHSVIEGIIRSKKLEDRVKLAGRQPDEVLHYAYAAADLFIMPNIPVPGDMEGFGVVLLEANIAKTPAIASNIEGMRDVIKDGKNGYKVECYDADGFANAIDHVLMKENVWQTLAESSKQYVEENFTWNKVAHQYISYLRKIVHNSK